MFLGGYKCLVIYKYPAVTSTYFAFLFKSEVCAVFQQSRIDSLTKMSYETKVTSINFTLVYLFTLSVYCNEN